MKATRNGNAHAPKIAQPRKTVQITRRKPAIKRKPKSMRMYQISPELLERAKIYLAMVDEPDGHTGTLERNAERTAAHERLMDEMEQCGIPFNSRFEARWIARWIVAQHQPKFDSTPSLLWAKPNGDNEWFKEIRHVPPEDNKEGWIPIVVTLQPLSSHPTIFERNHS